MTQEVETILHVCEIKVLQPVIAMQIKVHNTFLNNIGLTCSSLGSSHTILMRILSMVETVVFPQLARPRESGELIKFEDLRAK